MPRIVVLLAGCLSLAGCIGFTEAAPPVRDTVVVQPGATVVIPSAGSPVVYCPDGRRPPC